MHSVTIQPSGHQFQVEEGETVLVAALRQGFVLPYGCRNGACGSCKGKLLEGTVDYGVYQQKALTDDEKAQGKALFCQAQAAQRPGDRGARPSARPRTSR